MLHQDRGYTIKQVSTANELATLLGKFVWSATTGFDLHGTLFLNVSTAPDVMQEYAVVRNGHRVESISIGGLASSTLVSLIMSLTAGSAQVCGPRPGIVDTGKSDEE